MTTGKTIALTRQTFVGKVMSLLFNMLSRLVITFLPRSKRLLISWLQSPSAVILEPKKKKSQPLFPLFPHLFAMNWWKRIPWSKFTECWPCIMHRLFLLMEFHDSYRFYLYIFILFPLFSSDWMISNDLSSILQIFFFCLIQPVVAHACIFHFTYCLLEFQNSYSILFMISASLLNMLLCIIFLILLNCLPALSY